MSNRDIAPSLSRKYNVEVRQSRYRQDGKWYHHLQQFPAAFFDEKGYIVFKTKEEYENCASLLHTQDVHVAGNGISSIPGYVLFPDHEDRSTINEVSGIYEIQEIVPTESPIEFAEGGIEEIVVELRKRDPRLKLAAIRAHGALCQICGFDFFKTYGDIGEGYIELHHLHPLSESNEAQLTSLADVAIVCANCHRMLHRNGKKALPVEELIKIVQAHRPVLD